MAYRLWESPSKSLGMESIVMLTQPVAQQVATTTSISDLGC